MNERTFLTLEYDKVLSKVAEFAVLKGTKRLILSFKPETNFEEVKHLQRKTFEAHKLLYVHGVSGVEFFDEPSDELERAKKGASLSLAELIRSARLLKASRLVRNNFTQITDDEITILPSIAEGLYCDQYLEKEILSKVLSDEKVADDATDKLYQLRRKIKKLNDQIRDKLAYFLHNEQKYLQENIVTIRGDRYVIPVKSEHRSKIKGFVHDQSATGSTVFIEPVEVLELNNQLKTTMVEEALEVEEIIRDLSHKVGLVADNICANVDLVMEIDFCLSRAIYAFKTKSTQPILNNKGYISIINGRHPLIDKDVVVPLNIVLGKNYNFLLVTGPNTGGKTVTLKLCGLFVLMAESGMFLPSSVDTEISVFDEVFADIGDEQSIEQSLSTFSSHVKNLVEITAKANSKSLVLMDEIGAGTDPEEGSALAQAVLTTLLEKNVYGIVTTHYSKLKEFAYTSKKIVNASMEFDPETYAPIYKLNIGVPGSSNAIEIAKRLGLSAEITTLATELLSDNKIAFENVLKEAEKSRQKAKEELDKFQELTQKAKEELQVLEKEKSSLAEEKAKLFEKAKAETRRIVNDKVAEAEELIEKIKEIISKQELDGGDIITARTLKNKLDDKKYDLSKTDSSASVLEKLTIETAKVGTTVYLTKIGSYGVIQKPFNKNGETEVLVGSMRMKAKIKDMRLSVEDKKQEKPKVQISRKINTNFKNEVNVVGKRREEALDEVVRFIDQAVLSNQAEVKIIHGVGMKILSTSIHDILRKDKRVESFRFGTFGEGENGVTIVTLK